ncbi:ABC transporter substrate-binding protein [Qingshengfaniella alkalisoli]|uniref:Sugar ABC transporter substrate-binding protein n=1 Tax=Qingshengfaniella alkalisoli TaxID=2599296 RepID=A0A5B8IXL5_9RHOB|nr:sugar ABC transporter substrate-binding protein [Qingshengfaniella alkalisoli]QDY70902.1 sugar ABC transporter substrate-binding protein [Qingshengfaniella alkalisoli]
MRLTATLGASAIALSAAAGAASAEDLHMIVCGDDTGAGIPKQAALIEQWESENEGFDVTVEFVPWGQCQEKSTTLAAAGNPPAIAYMGSRTLKQLAKNDLIVPMELTDEEKATYAAPILGTVTWDGKVWGVPRAFSTKALFYNKDLFEAAGLDPEAPPTTWDEMYEAAKAIKDNTEADGFGLAAASFDNTMHQFLNYVYTNGGAVIDENGEIVFNSENNVQALEFYGKLAEVSQPGPVAYDRAKLTPLFSEGQIGMLISGPWVRSDVGDQVNYGIAPIPVGPMGGPGTLLITDSLTVFKGSGMEDQARDLVKLLTNPDNQVEFEIGEGFTPLRPDLPQVAELVAEDPSWEPFLAAIPTGGPEPFVTDYVGMQDAINEAVQGVVLGEVDAAEAIEYAAEMLEDYK